MKISLALLMFALGIVQTHALIVSEVMSNPTGDDGGREWIEIYNETNADIDLSSMTISIKGSTAIAATSLQGGVVLPASGYAVIASIVSGQTKFLQDYASYSGILFKSSISLVNTGVTSIDIKLQGSTVASIPSYTAAKEGSTLSFVQGAYGIGTPTPGSENILAPSIGGTVSSTSSTVTENQTTVAQMSPPSPDIVLYMPTEKVVVAGAETYFNVAGMTRSGKVIDGLSFVWAFGDGGQGVGSSTKHRYVYSGRYLAQVEGMSATIAGTGRMIVRVVPPDIEIVDVSSGKYGTYVDISNPNMYDLDISQWMLTFDGAAFHFPKNTLISSGATTRFAGASMGFAGTTVSKNTVVKILFPNLEEVTRFAPVENSISAGTVLGVATTTKALPVQVKQKVSTRTTPQTATTSAPAQVKAATSTIKTISSTRDTRLVGWFKSMFRRQ